MFPGGTPLAPPAIYGFPIQSPVAPASDITIPSICAWMGFPHLYPDPTQHGLPPCLFNMAKTAKGAPNLHRKFISDLDAFANLPENRFAFTNFHFSPTLHTELNKLQYGMEDPIADWHKGLGPGLAMNRERIAVLAKKRHFDLVDQYGGMGFTLGRLDEGKLAPLAPHLPTNYQEFLSFLNRYCKLLGFLLTPQCNLYQIVSQVSTQVLTNNRHLTAPDSWYQAHGAFIIWRLVLAARDFFIQTRTTEEFHTLGPIILASDPRQYVCDLLRDAAYNTTIDELPQPLRALLPGIPPVAIPLTTQAVHTPRISSAARSQPGAQPTTSPRPAQTPGKSPQPRTPRHIHPNPPGNLVQLFANIQTSPDIPGKNKQSSIVLQQAGLTVPSTLELLGLTSKDCLNFHMRGSCNRATCTNTHEVKHIAKHNLDTLFQKLSTVPPQLKGL
jgi:hypothetical protein